MSKVKVRMDKYGNKLVNMIETKPLCIKLGRHVNNGEKVNPIHFEGQR